MGDQIGCHCLKGCISFGGECQQLPVSGNLRCARRRWLFEDHMYISSPHTERIDSRTTRVCSILPLAQFTIDVERACGVINLSIRMCIVEAWRNHAMLERQ